MKIADFFVALGFDIKGETTLTRVDHNLKKAEINALALLAGVTALNAAFYAMVGAATGAAVALTKFNLATGQSADELQRWQYAGRLANVQANEMTDAFKAIQEAQTKLRLTGEGAAPFQFFGLSVNQSVPSLLKKLHEVIQTGDVGASRMMASQLGISENVFQFLRQSNLGLTEYNAKLTLSTENLLKLNRAWQSIVASLEMIRNRFAETFAGPLTAAARVIKFMVDSLGVFVVWLGKATPGATALRWALFGIVLALGALFVILSGVVLILGAFLIAVKALTVASVPLLLAIAPIVIVLGLMAVALGTAIVLIQDFWTQIAGGKSAFDWNDNLLLTVKNVERLARAIEWVLDNWKKLSIISALINPGVGIGMLQAQSAVTNGVRGLPANYQQTNDIKITVDGAKDPKATGIQVHRSLNRAISDASRQIPLAAP